MLSEVEQRARKLSEELEASESKSKELEAKVKPEPLMYS